MGIVQLDILERLKKGNERFVQDNLNAENQTSKQRNKTVKGQKPFAVILSCADSRVVPELIYDTGIGELFVVRVAGNVANTSSIASIEYAVAQLNTKLIVVMGHQSCGAVTAAVKGGDNGSNLDHLLSHIQPAVESTFNKSNLELIIRKNTEISTASLAGKSKIIQSSLEAGELKIVNAYYRLEDGKVDFWES